MAWTTWIDRCFVAADFVCLHWCCLAPLWPCASRFSFWTVGIKKIKDACNLSSCWEQRENTCNNSMQYDWRTDMQNIRCNRSQANGLPGCYVREKLSYGACPAKRLLQIANASNDEKVTWSRSSTMLKTMSRSSTMLKTLTSIYKWQTQSLKSSFLTRASLPTAKSQALLFFSFFAASGRKEIEQTNDTKATTETKSWKQEPPYSAPLCPVRPKQRWARSGQEAHKVNCRQQRSPTAWLVWK